MNSSQQDNHKKYRSIAFYTILGLFLLLVTYYVFVGIRPLLVPMIFGALLAYLCKPVIANMRVRNVKSFAKLCVFTLLIFSALAIAASQVKNAIPNAEEQLSLKIRLQYKINQIYDNIVDKEGSYLSTWLKAETASLRNNINTLLTLNEPEQAEFEKIYLNNLDENEEYSIVSYYLYVKNNYYGQVRKLASSKESIINSFNVNLSEIYSSFTAWLLMPIVFFFLLFDQGKIRRYLVSFIPNRYFELSLNIAYKVDKAIGSYLRGTFVQCSLVALSLFVCFFLIGFPFKAALLISIIAGVANAIPFLGPLIGLVIGLLYSLIIEDVNGILPLFSVENIYWGVILSVAIAQALDNIYFQPFVLGNAVNLHPLIVVLGVMAGAGLMGWVGMLLAVPSIVMLKVVVETLTQQLKAYKII